VPTDRGEAVSRDPRTDPREGDILFQAGGARTLQVDKVTDQEVAFRVIDWSGGLLGARRISILTWKSVAPHECGNPPKWAPVGFRDVKKNVVDTPTAKELYIKTLAASNFDQEYAEKSWEKIIKEIREGVEEAIKKKENDTHHRF